MSYQFAPSDTLMYPKQAVSRVSQFSPTLTFAITGVMDSDSVSVSTTMPISFSPDANFQLRYGRLAMSNVYGPENISTLPMPFGVEYLDGSRFVPNGGDSCTPWNVANITNTANHHSLAAVTGTFSAGSGSPLELEPDGTPGTDTLTWSMPVWLQDYWSGGVAPENPSAIATFGVYRGHDRVIYWREN
jgi:MSHA biogenesis protein MshQ